MKRARGRVGGPAGSSAAASAAAAEQFHRSGSAVLVGGASADCADWVMLMGAGCGSGRLRMPISNELTDRNFVTKIARYHRVVDVPNSMTVLTDMLPLSLGMSAAGVGPSC